MFYYPNRTQAIKIQQTLETLYNGIDLLSILTDIANKKTGVKSK